MLCLVSLDCGSCTIFASSKYTRPPWGQSRGRKVKCDGQEICGGCLARSIECVYDVKPRRRGPDKVPGSRRRRSGAPKDLSDLLPPPIIEAEGQTTITHSTASTSGSTNTAVPPRQSKRAKKAVGPRNEDLDRHQNTQNVLPVIARTPPPSDAPPLFDAPPPSDASNFHAGLDSLDSSNPSTTGLDKSVSTSVFNLSYIY